MPIRRSGQRVADKASRGGTGRISGWWISVLPLSRRFHRPVVRFFSTVARFLSYSRRDPFVCRRRDQPPLSRGLIAGTRSPRPPIVRGLVLELLVIRLSGRFIGRFPPFFCPSPYKSRITFPHHSRSRWGNG